MKALPSNQRLHEELAPKGLCMFLIHAQKEDKEWMEDYAKKKGLTFPIPMQSDCNFLNYDKGERISLPYAYVISPEGEVVWQGRDGYEAQVRAQIARIKYPKLRKLEVAPEVVEAATAFEAGEYADCRESALKVKAEVADNEATVADADYVLAKLEEHLLAMRARIELAKEEKRYHHAVAMLEELSGKAYKGMEVCDQADEELKALKKDKEVKAEIKAWEQYEKTLAAIEKSDEAEKRKALEKFVKKYEGTAAAKEADWKIAEMDFAKEEQEEE